MAVLLTTSLGDLVIDLHVDLCPLTSKNFLKLCKMKYYNNCLFHLVQKDFIAQTGDPTGTGSGGDSLYKHLYGDQARFFDDEIHPKLTHGKIGSVAMASAGENLNASQFYFSLQAGLDYLDGKHTVFGEVAEGLDTLMRINDAYVDEKGRPYKNIRIKHVSILDDPFEDPPQLTNLIPDKSPEVNPLAEDEEVRLEDDWVPMDEQVDADELDKSLRRKEAHSRAVVLEMVGDIPEADVKPPENVLFVCKLNPVTEDDDLKTIFARFGKIIAADIIRDYKTGDSLCYGFIEFEAQESCEAAYIKMDNVLIDDRRIHVDFSQSVAKLWTRFRRFGNKDMGGQGNIATQPRKGDGCFKCGEQGHFVKDCQGKGEEEENKTHTNRPKYVLKDRDTQRGHVKNRYDMVFGDEEGARTEDYKKSSDLKRPRYDDTVFEERAKKDNRETRHSIQPRYDMKFEEEWEQTNDWKESKETLHSKRPRYGNDMFGEEKNRTDKYLKETYHSKQTWSDIVLGEEQGKTEKDSNETCHSKQYKEEWEQERSDNDRKKTWQSKQHRNGEERSENGWKETRHSKQHRDDQDWERLDRGRQKTCHSKNYREGGDWERSEKYRKEAQLSKQHREKRDWERSEKDTKETRHSKQHKEEREKDRKETQYSIPHRQEQDWERTEDRKETCHSKQHREEQGWERSEKEQTRHSKHREEQDWARSEKDRKKTRHPKRTKS